VARVVQLLNRFDGPIGFHPLDYAAMNGREEMGEILLAFGATIDAKDNFYGETPLVPVVPMQVA
jgi:ankyrin repeat protein